jgi:hypothetical protein
MLELHDAAGAFEALEDYLAAGRFRGRTGVVAELYLGYGLSDSLRRTAFPAPPEACPPSVPAAGAGAARAGEPG